MQPQRLGIRIENLGAHSDVDVVARRVCRALISVIPWGEVKERTAQIRNLVLKIHRKRIEQEKFVGLLCEDDEAPPDPAALDVSAFDVSHNPKYGIQRISSPKALRSSHGRVSLDDLGVDDIGGGEVSELRELLRSQVRPCYPLLVVADQFFVSKPFFCFFLLAVAQADDIQNLQQQLARRQNAAEKRAAHRYVAWNTP